MSSLNITGNIDFLANVVPDFEILNLPASVDEGQSISPTIGITSKWSGLLVNTTRVYWEISGVGIASTDFENVDADGNPDPGTTLTGYVDLPANNASKQFAIGIRSDNFTDLNVNETATFSLYSDVDRIQLLSSDTFIINDTSMEEPQFDFLLVGGGGKGGSTETVYGSCGGGGGAGGVLVVNNESIAVNDVIYCEVAGIQTSNANGNDTILRQNTSTGTILHQIKGGGRGASDNYTGGSAAGSSSDPFGGSGGGGSSVFTIQGGFSGSYGRDGGDGENLTDGTNRNGAGGGGGYSSNGQDATTGFTVKSGNGGNGYNLTWFFSELSTDGPDGDERIAGGGGGGAGFYPNSGSGWWTAGDGGSGGAGDGGSSGSDGSDAADNSGSGGGGASGFAYASNGFQFTQSLPRSGGNGGSGVIYLKYIAPESLFTYTGTQTVNSYIVSSGGGTKKYWVHKLTGSGELTRVS